ncbi:MAG TPA: hypothetical protein VGB73_18990 [Pyrinomonadaceae bacterium]
MVLYCTASTMIKKRKLPLVAAPKRNCTSIDWPGSSLHVGKPERLTETVEFQPPPRDGVLTGEERGSIESVFRN